MRREVELELSSSLNYVVALPCEMSSGQLNYTPLHTYRPSDNNIFMSVRWHLFHEFLFVYYFSSWCWRNYDIIEIFCWFH